MVVVDGAMELEHGMAMVHREERKMDDARKERIAYWISRQIYFSPLVLCLAQEESELF